MSPSVISILKEKHQFLKELLFVCMLKIGQNMHGVLALARID